MPLPQKTVLIIRNAYSFDFGGGERFPVSLAEELQNHDFSPVVITRSSKLIELARTKKIKNLKGWWWSYQDFSGPRIILFPLYVLWQVILSFWYMLLIIRLNPAVVHPQSRDDFIAATFAGRIFARRVIWTDHADLKYIWQNHSTWYKNPLGKLVYLASHHAHNVTLVSNAEKHQIETTLGHSLPKKFTVIHNGANDTPVQPVKRPKGSTVFVATSRMVTAKGIGELIQAFRRLSVKTPELWLLGEGPEKKHFQEEAGQAKNIKFLNFPTNALDYVAAADVFVHPSYNEGFSISLVEAAMLGKPIIACNVGGNPEIVINNKNGLLVKPRDVDSLYAAMTELAKQSELRDSFGKQSRTLYEKDFIFSQIVTERFLPLYEK